MNCILLAIAFVLAGLGTFGLINLVERLASKRRHRRH